MEQSLSRQANSFSSSQEIPRILWNPKFHYRNHNRPSTLPILRQISPVKASKSHFLNSLIRSMFRALIRLIKFLKELQ